MPSGVSTYGSARWLDAMFGVIAPPAMYYIALCSTSPGPEYDGDMIAQLEPADTNYQRRGIAATGAHWASNGNYITNSTSVDFPLAATNWGRLTHYALLDSSTHGNLYGWGEFGDPQYAEVGFLLAIPAGGIVVALAPQQASIAV